MPKLDDFAGKYQLERVENLERFIAELQLSPAVSKNAKNIQGGTLELTVNGFQVTVAAKIGNMSLEPYVIVVGGDAQEIDLMGLVKTYAKAKFSFGKLTADLDAPHVGGPLNGEGKPMKMAFEIVGDKLKQTVEIGSVLFQQWFIREKAQ